MKDILTKKAEIWCERISGIMKEKGYTQKTFLKEYRERYGGGTQANISRWHRVGSKIEGEKIIGFPSFETVSNIADLLGVSVGYLTGETDFESFDMERTCEFMGIDEDTVKAVKGIVSGQSVQPFGKYTASEYTAVLKYLLTAKNFPEFIKEIREYADNIYHQMNPIDYMGLKARQINKNNIDLAIQCLDYQCNSDEQYGGYDDFKENNVEPTDELFRSNSIIAECKR
jgi:transcriptional regulator with XRE-family HTH domain